MPAMPGFVGASAWKEGGRAAELLGSGSTRPGLEGFVGSGASQESSQERAAGRTEPAAVGERLECRVVARRRLMAINRVFCSGSAPTPQLLRCDMPHRMAPGAAAGTENWRLGRAPPLIGRSSSAPKSGASTARALLLVGGVAANPSTRTTPSSSSRVALSACTLAVVFWSGH